MIWKQLWKRFRLLKQLAKVFALLSLLFLNGMNINTDQLRKLKCWVKFQEAISPKHVIITETFAQQITEIKPIINIPRRPFIR